MSSVSKRDYYEVLGVERDGDGTADQERVSQAGAEVPSRSQSRRPQGRGSVQGSGRGLRDPRRSREARGSTTASATPASAAPARAGFDPTIFADFSDIFAGLGDVFGFGESSAAPPARRTAARLRPALRPRDLLRGIGHRHRDDRSRFRAKRPARPAAASGAAAGTRAETCSQCRGAGQLRYQQGFLTVARPCSTCRGTGKTIAKPCQACRGAGRVGRERKLTVKIPAGIATGQRLRLYGEGEHGSAGGPSGDLYVVVHVQEHSFFHREEDDLYCELPISFPTLALGGSVKVPTLDGRERDHDSGRHAAGRAVQAARQGHAERDRAAARATSTSSRASRSRRSSRRNRSTCSRSWPKTLPQEKLDGDGGRAPRSRSSNASRIFLARLSGARSAVLFRAGRRPSSAICSTRELDDFEPVAIHEHDAARRLARLLPHARDSATRRARRWPRRWAIACSSCHRSTSPTRTGRAGARRRSTAVHVGRIIVAPPWDVPQSAGIRTRIRDPDPGSRIPDPDGFSSSSSPRWASAPAITRRRGCACELLQQLDLRGARVMDVGTGSGVLALAAWKLGAAGRDRDRQRSRRAAERARQHRAQRRRRERSTSSRPISTCSAGRSRRHRPGKPDRPPCCSATPASLRGAW